MDRNKMLVFKIAILISIVFNSSVLQANDSKNEEQITTQKQAAIHAAKLANEKCQKNFGISPFKPELYKAELVNSKWHWGKIEPIGIHGYSAKVEFCKDGSGENVQVAFSTDKIINNEPELHKVPMEIEVIRSKELEKVFPKIDSHKDK
ncbi:MAG: hypothetical protein GX654_02960 [Desulfatiglans sp.]|jgi:hypothetical protein|nr:hypothetical protein [Desulfatiglans sp.]